MRDSKVKVKWDGVLIWLVLIPGLGLFFWINSFVIPAEEEYLKNKFGDEFDRYSLSVKRWLFF